MLLNSHTYYSLRYGTMSPEELLQEVEAKGYEAFVLTDINNSSAAIETVREAQERNVKPILGIDFRNGMKPLYVGIAKNNEGFLQLNQFLSPYLHRKEELPERAPELKDCFFVYPFSKTKVLQLGENEYVGVQPHELRLLPFSVWKNKLEKLVVLQPATFRNKRDFNAHRLLRAIDLNTLLSKLPISEQTLPDHLLLPKDELVGLYKEYPQIIKNTERIFEDCSVHFDFKTNKNKRTFLKSQADDFEKLKQLCYQGLPYRYKELNSTIEERIEKELRIIRDYNFCSYFLINWDLVRYAQRKGYYYVGRGSGANSIVAYLLRITDVDPLELDLYFERFINPYRRHPPDFDIDFSWTDRDDVTRYLFNRYREGQVTLQGSYNTFKHDSVTREIGKIFGLPPDEIKQIQRASSVQSLDKLGGLVKKYSSFIHKFPSYLSVHSSGILISEDSINNYSSTFLPPKNFPTTQFDMHAAEDIGLYKFDILSQRGLGKIKDGLEIIKQNRGVDIDIHDIDKLKRDEKIKDLLKNGKAIGCFYVESPAMRMLLTKLKADDYLRLVAASSIIRPGVAKSGMMREYILRFRDKKRCEEAQKTLPELYNLLKETYGVMVYQEDVIKIVHLFAGLSLAEADIIRRGMSWKFKERSEFHKVRDKFFQNCNDKGYPQALVADIWRQIETFANFAFSKGHSASYAVESFQALYLKAYYPMEFMVANINNGGGFYRPELYFHEARMEGASIELPCVNHSVFLTSIQDCVVHIGFHMLHSLESKMVYAILKERKEAGAFLSIQDFLKRVPSDMEQVRLLIRSGAFRFTGKTKKELLWDLCFLMAGKKKTEKKIELFETETKELTLPQLDYIQNEDAFDEMELFGFPLCPPFDIVDDLPGHKLTMALLRSKVGQTLTIVGYLIHVKTTRTSRGDKMHFGVFLDLDGYWLDTVHFPPVVKQFPFRGKGCYEITGKVVEEFEFVSLEVSSLKRLPYFSIEQSTRLKKYDKTLPARGRV